MIRKAKVIPNKQYVGMFRVQWPDKKISDMVNLSRANDAARRFNDALRPSRTDGVSRAGSSLVR